MGLFFCVFYTQILQEVTFLWNKSWIFYLFLMLIAYVHILNFFTRILNLHGSCGNHSWLPLKGWWHSPNPQPQVPILRHISVQVLGLLSYLGSQATKSFSDVFWQNFLLVTVGPALACCRIRQVSVPTLQKAAGVGLMCHLSQILCSEPRGWEAHKRTATGVTRAGLLSLWSRLSRCCSGLSPIWFFLP